MENGGIEKKKKKGKGDEEVGRKQKDTSRSYSDVLASSEAHST